MMGDRDFQKVYFRAFKKRFEKATTSSRKLSPLSSAERNTAKDIFGLTTTNAIEELEHMLETPTWDDFGTDALPWGAISTELNLIGTVQHHIILQFDETNLKYQIIHLSNPLSNFVVDNTATIDWAGRHKAATDPENVAEDSWTGFTDSPSPLSLADSALGSLSGSETSDSQTEAQPFLSNTHTNKRKLVVIDNNEDTPPKKRVCM